jgi:hypothetical protein
MIEVKFWLKSPTGLQTTNYYSFTEEEFAALRQGFDAYASRVSPAKQFATFHCSRGEKMEKVQICVRWDDVAFIG